MEVNIKKNRYIHGLENLESRSLLYNILLEKTGIEITKGATILKSDEGFELGRKALAIEIINELNEFCPQIVKKMRGEVEDYGEY